MEGSLPVRQADDSNYRKVKPDTARRHPPNEGFSWLERRATVTRLPEKRLKCDTWCVRYIIRHCDVTEGTFWSSECGLRAVNQEAQKLHPAALRGTSVLSLMQAVRSLPPRFLLLPLVYLPSPLFACLFGKLMKFVFGRH